jgi:uncharacterized repeat protein (TIGR03803 family)
MSLPLTRSRLFGLTSIAAVFAAGVLVPSRIASAQTAYSIVHTFAGSPAEGSDPETGLVQGSDGNFFGTTSEGGAYGYGTVFKMTSSGVVTILHSFAFASPDGVYPRGVLIQAADGYFYGTTDGGGVYGSGTVFRMTSAGVVTILHSFAYSMDGS